MTLVELKNYIDNNLLPSDFMIFIRKDNDFLVKQYVEALSSLAPNNIVNKISSIYDPMRSSLILLTTSEALNILTVETFDERSENYSQFKNTIVVCDQVDKSILKNVENYIIEFPKLKDWQTLEYLKTFCEGLDEEDLSWLIKITDNSINRIINEIDKISLFDKIDQKAIFNYIKFELQSDLYTSDLFTIVNALIDGNQMILFEFLSHNNYEKLEPVAIVNKALISLKNIILISQNPSLGAEACGVSKKQYEYLKNHYRSINIKAAKAKLSFLANFDLDLKTSKLDLSKRDMFNYLLSHLAYKITS